jgi:hypothetical protein
MQVFNRENRGFGTLHTYFHTPFHTPKAKINNKESKAIKKFISL